jgi:hypothetical protein
MNPKDYSSEDQTYRVAFVAADGSFEVVDEFDACDDDAANDYAAANYGNQEWFVLNADGQNINGEPQPEPVDVELAEADETIRQRAGLEDFAGLEHPAMAAACQAYHAAVVEALADDPRARRLNVISPKGRRILHSQWCGAGFAYTQGAIGVMSGSLTADEKQAISDADDAGRAAAANEIKQEDAAT